VLARCSAVAERFDVKCLVLVSVVVCLLNCSHFVKFIHGNLLVVRRPPFPNYFFNNKGNTYCCLSPGLPVNLFHSDFVYAQYIFYEAGVNTSSDLWGFSACTAMTLFRDFGEMYLRVTEFRSCRS
jgi:hypothetical protein